MIEGEVTDNNGSILSSLNGTVYPVVFDKPQTITTKANDPGSQQTSFQQQSNILFKGKAIVAIMANSVFLFKVPKGHQLSIWPW